MVDKLIAYYRVSTDTQQKNDNIDLQREACNAYALKTGANIIEEFAESEGYSGSIDDRPAYQNAINRLKDSDVDGLIVYALDRWSRKKRSSIITMLDLEDLGKKVYLAQTEEILDWSREGDDLILQIKSWLSAKEREKIQARLAMGRERVKKESGWNHWKRKEVDMREVDRLMKMGVPKTIIAEHLHIHRQTLYKKLKERQET
jgi:DNA invertase Pin-like site-specific DNA recombinase